jgi:hypothetical protein
VLDVTQSSNLTGKLSTYPGNSQVIYTCQCIMHTFLDLIVIE